jgi:hypothetical protein
MLFWPLIWLLRGCIRPKICIGSNRRFNGGLRLLPGVDGRAGARRQLAGGAGTPRRRLCDAERLDGERVFCRARRIRLGKACRPAGRGAVAGDREAGRRGGDAAHGSDVPLVERCSCDAGGTKKAADIAAI